MTKRKASHIEALLGDTVLIDVPHVELRRTEVHKCADTDVVVSGVTAVLPMLREILQSRDQEVFVALMLDVRNRVIAWREVARGNAFEVIVPIPLLFRTALACGAHSLIVAHNHPSGDPKPSRNDIIITEKLIELGSLINISVLDHIIIGDAGRYYAFIAGGAGRSATKSLATNAPRQPPELD